MQQVRCEQGSEAYAIEKTTIQGNTMLRGLWRSSRKPRPGDAAATVKAAMLNPAEVASRCQPKLAVSGLRKSPNV